MKVDVKDAFEIRPGTPKMQHAPGLVLVLGKAQAGNLRRGAHIELTRPDGSSLEAVVAETKHHGESITLFIEGLSLEDAPSGTSVSWSNRAAVAVASRSGRRR